MPSGNVTLLEAAKCGSDTLKRGVVETIIAESPFLEVLPIMTIQGNALKHSVEGTLPTVQFRNVNEGYTKSWGSDTEHYWGTVILGGEVFVDNYLVRVRGNVISVKAKQYAKVAKAAARTFDKYMIDGTGTAKDFKGLNALIDEGFGQSFGANNDAQNGGALLLDDLDVAHDLMRGRASADAIYLNRTVRRLITWQARNTGGQFPLLDVLTTELGRKVTTWNDIPLRIVGDDQNGNLILDFDETRGNNNATTSLYFVSFGDDGLTGLMGAGGTMEVVDFGETEAAPGHLGRIEFYPGIAVFDPHSVVRVPGITNALPA